MRNENLFFLFLHQNICCGYSKEPSQWDGSFEHPKHILKLMGKKIFTFLRWNFYLNLWGNWQKSYKTIKITMWGRKQTHHHVLLWDKENPPLDPIISSETRLCWVSDKIIWVQGWDFLVPQQYIWRILYILSQYLSDANISRFSSKNLSKLIKTNQSKG